MFMSPRLLCVFVAVTTAVLVFGEYTSYGQRVDCPDLERFAFCETGCPDNWVSYRGHCYMFGNHHLADFNSSEKYCRQLDAYLVHVGDSYENVFIENQLSERKDASYVIGLTDMLDEGEWVWYGTGIPTAFADWAPGEPGNGVMDEDCVTYEPHTYQWHDVRCDRVFNAICEKDSSCSSAEIVG